MSVRSKLCDIANELDRLSSLPEHAWDSEDYAKRDACAKKLLALEPQGYKYDPSWLIDDEDYEDALRERR